MPNLAVTTATFWSSDPAALSAVRARVAGPPVGGRGAPGSGSPAQPPPSRLSRWWRAAQRNLGAPDAVPSPTHPPSPHDFSLEAAVPSGLDPERWDSARAVDLWGCGRPEHESRLVEQGPDRLVYDIVTPWSGPDAVFAALSGQHPGVVVHATTTCETEYASTAWFVAGAAVRARETGLELSDEELDAWDGAWDLPPDWAFDAEVARSLAEGRG